MQIFYINEDAPQPQTLSVKAPLHFNSLKWNEQGGGTNVKIPYNDINIVRQLGAHLTFIAWAQDILYIDFEKSKAFLIVDLAKQKIQLQIVIYPQMEYEIISVFQAKTATVNFEVKLSAKEFKHIMWNLVAMAA